MGIVYKGYDDSLERPSPSRSCAPSWPALTHGLDWNVRLEPRSLQARSRCQRLCRRQHGPGVALPGDGICRWPDPGRASAVSSFSAPTAEVIAQAADGLAAAHAAGLIHRDIKPSNIIIDPETGRAKLLDFGLVRATERPSGVTQEGLLAGTPTYMSPEQARGQPTASPLTDVYSLGVTLYESLTGEQPFRGKPHLVLQQILHEEPHPHAGLTTPSPATWRPFA